MVSGEMSTEQFTGFLSTATRLLAEHSADESVHFVCMDFRHMQEILTAGRAAYTELKNLIVWAKDVGGMGTFYRSRHELIFAFKNGTAPHINNFESGQHGRYRTNLWEYRGVNSFDVEECRIVAIPQNRAVQRSFDQHVVTETIDAVERRDFRILYPCVPPFVEVDSPGFWSRACVTSSFE